MSTERAETPSTKNLRALVVYESMFGCTEEVARAVAEGLELENVVTTVVNVLDAPPAREATFDLLLVGAPTHAFSLSRQSTRQDAVRQGAPAEVAAAGLREWLSDMAADEAADRPAAAFDTRVTKVRHLPKAAGTRASHLLARHGYTIISKPTPFFVEDVRGPLVEGELGHAVTWGRVVALAARRHQTTGDHLATN